MRRGRARISVLPSSNGGVTGADETRRAAASFTQVRRLDKRTGLPRRGLPPRCAAPAVLGLALLIACVPARFAVAAPESADFTRCQQRFVDAPAERDSSLCFYEVARRLDRWDEAAARLRALRQSYPDVHWVTLHLAYVQWNRQPDRAENLLRQAADGFSRQGDIRGELSARGNLLSHFQNQGRSEEAAAEALRVKDLGARTDDPEVQINAWTTYAFHLRVVGQDLREAYRILKQAEATGIEDQSYWVRKRFLRTIGAVSKSLGRLNEAGYYLRRLEEVARARGDRRGIVHARVARADVMIKNLEALPREEGRADARRFMEETVRLAVELDDRFEETRARWQTALLSLREDAPPSRARFHLERCLERAAPTTTAMDRILCRALLAVVLADADPKKASSLMDAVLAATAKHKNPKRLAEVWRARVELAWKHKSPEEATDVALAGLKTIEVIRSLQPPGAGRIGAFSRWTRDYYGLSGRLLRLRETGGGAEATALAFAVMERMRARGLLDALESTQRRATPEMQSLADARDDALHSIARIQRMMLDPQLPAERRAEFRAALEPQERRAEALREKLWRATGGVQRYRPRVFGTVDQVREALADDEAMLLFQLGLSTKLNGHFGGGAWLWVVTRETATVLRIPDRLELEDKIRTFIGLFADGAGPSSPAARRLYRDLLAEGVERLPPRVRRLVVVPDGRLHQLPFAALESESGLPLVARYALSSVPSATFWLEGRRRVRREENGWGVLAFVDPSSSQALLAQVRDALDAFSLELGSLPGARAEGRTAVDQLGGTSRLREGSDATEAAFKRDVKEPYRLIHFGTHAFVDEISPERSAVILTAADPNEDGLLQAREIADLDLAGRVVILASCRSAGGAVAGGEGVMSLSRAFLAAGAEAVVGSRWPLRDDDAYRLFDAFYRELSRGRNLSDSIVRAQRAVLEDGHLPTAWAGLVVLGNGSLTPFPGGSPAARTVIRIRVAAGVVAGLTALGLVVAYVRHRRRSVV